MGQGYGTAWKLGSLGGVSVEAQFFWGSPIQWWHCSRALLTGCGWMNVGSHPWHSSVCLKHLYSYKMVLLLSTTSPFKMSWHDLLRTYSSFLCFITVSWAYKMPQKKLDDLTEELSHQNPYKMNTSKPTTLPFWVFSYKMLRWWGLL